MIQTKIWWAVFDSRAFSETMDDENQKKKKKTVADTGTTKIPLTCCLRSMAKIWPNEDLKALGILRGVQWDGLGSNLKTRNECAYNNLGTEARLMVQQAAQQSHCGCPSHSKSSNSWWKHCCLAIWWHGPSQQQCHELMTCQVACVNHEWLKAPPNAGVSEKKEAVSTCSCLWPRSCIRLQVTIEGNPTRGSGRSRRVGFTTPWN